jgi:heme oxygenase
MTEVIVKFEHLRKLNYCARSGRRWFQTYGPQIGYSWNDFLSGKVPATAVESVGEMFGTNVAAQARKENTNGR